MDVNGGLRALTALTTGKKHPLSSTGPQNVFGKIKVKGKIVLVLN
jgi:hypothetical protein